MLAARSKPDKERPKTDVVIKKVTITKG